MTPKEFHYDTRVLSNARCFTVAIGSARRLGDAKDTKHLVPRFEGTIVLS